MGAPLLTELEDLLTDLQRKNRKHLQAPELERLGHLYRHGQVQLAEARASGTPKSSRRKLEALLAGAYGQMHRARPKAGRLGRAVVFLMQTCPRALRAEWRLCLACFALEYGLAILAFALVKYDPDLAYSLLNPEAVAHEVAQLEGLSDGEAFRGNFNFGIGDSPQAAAMIAPHNMDVGILYFAAGLIPPLFILIFVSNAFMLGVYTAVAHGYGQAGSISSILWCHGVLEIQAFVLASCAGMVLLRGALIPGHLSRAQAMGKAGTRAWQIMAPLFPILFISGLIEGFVSPHASTPVRMAVAVSTGVLLLTWVFTGGRKQPLSI